MDYFLYLIILLSLTNHVFKFLEDRMVYLLTIQHSSKTKVHFKQSF